MAVSALALLLVATLIATSDSVASGVPGGIFTPMLLMGATLGSGWPHLFGAAQAAAPGAGRYTLIGMAATTAASIHAPLTAAVYEIELRKRGLGWDITLEGRQFRSNSRS